MSENPSQTASSKQSEPVWPFNISRADTSVVKNDPVNLSMAYLKAEWALADAGSGTSPKELSELRTNSVKALRAWREADDQWRERLDDLISSMYRKIKPDLSIVC
jgi:hypothetical protein